MADKTQFELVSPERLLISKAVDMVVVPGTEGDFGVLPDHAPLISSVRPGVIAVFENGQVTDRISFEPVLIAASIVPLVATALVFLLIRPRTA